MTAECTVEKFLVTVATGNISRVRALTYSKKHFTTQIRMSPPQIPIYLNYGNVFHLVAALGNLEMLNFLWEELQTYEKTFPLRVICAGDNLETTPIMTAAGKNHSSTVALFLDFGVPIDERTFASNYGMYTTLFYAVMCQGVESARTLLERNANPNIVISKRGTALHTAVETFLRRPTTSHDMIDLLLYWSANPFLYPDTKIKIATLRPSVKKGQRGNSVKFLPLSSSDPQKNEIEKWQKIMKKNPSKFLSSKRCIIIKEEVAIFPIDTEICVYVYTEPNPYQLARSHNQYDLANKLAAYGNAQNASLRLMRYARVLLHISEGNLGQLVKPLIIIILLHKSHAFGRLTSQQVQSIIDFASTKTTLGTSQISFLQNCVFSFFRDRIPVHEEFNLSQYILPKPPELLRKTKK